MAAQFAASVQHMGNPEDLLEAAAYFCTLEGVRLHALGKRFVRLDLLPTQTTHAMRTIAELLRQVQANGTALGSLTKKFAAVVVHGTSPGE